MAHRNIVIKGAREHNLKNVTVEIPRDRLIVITGISGSGKSSLAFDTLYAEGQRRYVESLSAYARQFLEQMDKPDVDSIEGLSPAISIEQKTTSKNPRSTVGTVTEIYDHLRLLYARVGRPHCHQCGRPIASQTIQQMVDQTLALPPETRVRILAPIVRGRKGEYRKELADIAPLVARTLVAPSARPEVVQELIESMCMLHKDSYIKTIEGMTLYTPITDVSEIRVPVQIIVGAEDKLTPPSVSKKMADAIPGARLLVLERTGHMSNLESRDAFDQCVREFLNGID